MKSELLPPRGPSVHSLRLPLLFGTSPRRLRFTVRWRQNHLFRRLRDHDRKERQHPRPWVAASRKAGLNNWRDNEFEIIERDVGCSSKLAQYRKRGVVQRLLRPRKSRASTGGWISRYAGAVMSFSLFWWFYSPVFPNIDLPGCWRGASLS